VISARSGAALLLLAYGLSLASVRMDGLGPNLASLIDDPVTDLLRYPQLSVLTPGWLVGIELNQPGSYHPYARATGRWSVAAALDATLSDSTAHYDPSVALATQVGPVSIGAAATFGFIDEPVPPRLELPDDTMWPYIWKVRDIGKAVLGARWYGPGFTLDGNVNGYVWERYVWHQGGILIGRGQNLWLTPALRMSWPGEHLRWRGIASYEYKRHNWPGTYGGASCYHTLSLSGGPTFTAGNLLATAGLHSTVRTQQLSNWLYWDLCLPLGIEWNSGPVVFRLGADAGVSFQTATGWPGADNMEFRNHTYVGLGLRPVEHLRLDFTPDMDNAANLRGWSLAAALDF